MAKRRCVESSREEFWTRPRVEEKRPAKRRQYALPSFPADVGGETWTASVVGKARITQKLGVFGNRKVSRSLLAEKRKGGRFDNDLQRLLQRRQLPGENADDADVDDFSATFVDVDAEPSQTAVSFQTERRFRNRNPSPAVDVSAALNRWTMGASSVENDAIATEAKGAADADESPTTVGERTKLRLDGVFPDLRCRDSGELYVDRTARRIYRQMMAANPEIAPQQQRQQQRDETPDARRAFSALAPAATAAATRSGFFSRTNFSPDFCVEAEDKLPSSNCLFDFGAFGDEASSVGRAFSPNFDDIAATSGGLFGRSRFSPNSDVVARQHQQRASTDNTPFDPMNFSLSFGAAVDNPPPVSPQPPTFKTLDDFRYPRRKMF